MTFRSLASETTSSHAHTQLRLARTHRTATEPNPISRLGSLRSFLPNLRLSFGVLNAAKVYKCYVNGYDEGAEVCETWYARGGDEWTHMRPIAYIIKL